MRLSQGLLGRAKSQPSLRAYVTGCLIGLIGTAKRRAARGFVFSRKIARAACLVVEAGQGCKQGGVKATAHERVSVWALATSLQRAVRQYAHHSTSCGSGAG